MRVEARAWLELLASAVVARSGSLGGGQRFTQVVLVWLLPVVGAIVVLAVAASDRSLHAGALGCGEIGYLADAASFSQGADVCHSPGHDCGD